ncbi:hypothetical protein ACTXT7_000755 [Hymenolepis weldensis]
MHFVAYSQEIGMIKSVGDELATDNQSRSANKQQIFTVIRQESRGPLDVIID